MAPMALGGDMRINMHESSRVQPRTSLLARSVTVLLGMGAISLLSWWLFSAAQTTSKAGPADERDFYTWLFFTALMGLGWIAGTAMEYRFDRDERRAVRAWWRS